MQKEVINELSKFLLGGDYTYGDVIVVDTDAKGLTFSKKGSKTIIGTNPTEKAATPTKADAKRKTDLDKLMKATDDVKNAAKTLKDDKEEDDDDDGDDPKPKRKRSRRGK